MLCLSDSELYSRWVPLFFIRKMCKKIIMRKADARHICYRCFHSDQKNEYLWGDQRRTYSSDFTTKMLLSLTNIPGRVRVKITAIPISKRLAGYVTVAKGPRRGRGWGVWGKQHPRHFLKNEEIKLSAMDPRYMFVMTRFVNIEARISSTIDGRDYSFFSYQKGAIIRGRAFISNIAHWKSSYFLLLFH